MSILVIGGTGTLGRQIVREALDEGYHVKCLVREFRKSSFLRDWGAELIYGDLSLPSTLPKALKGIEIIIDSATLRSKSKYTSEIIDWRGKLALLEAAKLTKIKKFICFSVLDALKNFFIFLIDLKLRIERELEIFKINFIIFQCSGFYQGLISQYALPILENEIIWLPENSIPIAYLDTQDASKAIMRTLDNSSCDNKKVSLIGKKLWKPCEIINLCELLSGKTARISYIPVISFNFIGNLLRLFEFSWNIADRLQFCERSKDPNLDIKPFNEIFWSIERVCLEAYLQEYFGKILQKLRKTSYQTLEEVSFL
jgi:uncharacterized protein YbjT (DUF2867 family)